MAIHYLLLFNLRIFIIYGEKLLNKFVKQVLLLIIVAIGLVLLILGLNNYPGSKLIYLLFSAVFLLMLLTAVNKRTHYGYLFLVIALSLGFWVKITAHLILNYPYVEPIGQFDGSATAWDSVLWVAISASIGVILARLIITLAGIEFVRIVSIDHAKVPAWYSALRKWLWPLSLMLILCIGAVNLILGIQQIGLVPRTILPWPMNALIAWQVSIGSALLLTVLLWWEIASKRSISLSVYALLIEAMTSTTTLLSRGVYIFHTVPQFFSLFENRRSLLGMTRAKIVALVLVFAALLVTAISAVSTFRAYMYPHAGGFTTEEQMRLTRLEVLEGGIARVKILITQGQPHEEHLRELLAEKVKLEKVMMSGRIEVLDGGITRVKKLIAQGEPHEKHLRDLLAERSKLEDVLSGKNSSEKILSFNDKSTKVNNAPSLAAGTGSLLENRSKLLSEFYYQFDGVALQRILALVVDRWIGLEGVMAVSSYPEKNNKLLLDAITEKRSIGSSTKFQEIAKSHYQWTDANVWQFASLPGAAAFFYLSGSLWLVILGMAVFALLLQLIEQFIFRITSNPLLCSMLGLTLANTISQFGITPRQDIPFYSMIFIFIILVCVMQSQKFSEIYLKHASRLSKRELV